jgi:hypothetical protein
MSLLHKSCGELLDTLLFKVCRILCFCNVKNNVDTCLYVYFCILHLSTSYRTDNEDMKIAADESFFCKIKRSKCMTVIHCREEQATGCALRPKNVQNNGARTITSCRWHVYNDTIKRIVSCHTMVRKSDIFAFVSTTGTILRKAKSKILCKLFGDCDKNTRAKSVKNVLFLYD